MAEFRGTQMVQAHDKENNEVYAGPIQGIYQDNGKAVSYKVLLLKKWVDSQWKEEENPVHKVFLVNNVKEYEKGCVASFGK